MNNTGEIILYQPDETIRLEVRIEDETVWLTQAQMVDLFQRDVSVISRHINNVFKEGELDKKAICIFCKLLFQISPLSLIALMLLFRSDIESSLNEEHNSAFGRDMF